MSIHTHTRVSSAPLTSTAPSSAKARQVTACRHQFIHHLRNEDSALPFTRLRLLGQWSCVQF